MINKARMGDSYGGMDETYYFFRYSPPPTTYYSNPPKHRPKSSEYNSSGNLVILAGCKFKTMI